MLVVLCLTGILAGDAVKNTPAHIVAEHEAAVKALDAERRNPRAKPAKIATLTKKAQPDGYAARLLASVKDSPESPESFGALAWILRHNGGPEMVAVQAEAAELLAKHHLADPKLPKLFNDLTTARHAAAESLLRAALEKAPSRETRGKACIALCAYLVSKAQWSDYCRFSDVPQRRMLESTPQGTELYKWATKAFARDLRDESKELNTRIAKEFADLRPPATPAKAGGPRKQGGPEVGKPAPEIEGKDLEGKPMSLSDFRGKVVVIEFWGWWCVYCRSLVPPDESLISTMRGRPFVLVGVNSDRDIAATKKAAGEAGLGWPSWRSWRDGAAIAAAWGIERWPTTLVIDHRGVVRFVGLTGQELQDAVENLIREIPEGR